ncbi:hypothetical protein EJ08DRAFT_658369 [Tothia fuscella]|uniref:INO80 complex subunit B-like conserved region domain-containing protein n=1 Tax=Tothia fuscella TaxID=1048955 RepID=A0A9P4NWS7_9PEZI|nr:hypothetical protein EJ08DRAFT_658369 [Tothia fuscella]
MPPRRHLRTRKELTPPPSAPVSSRPRRAAAVQAATTIERSSPDEARHSSIRLTVKSDPKKLKEATSGSASKRSITVNSRDVLDGEIVNGPRQRKKAIVEESSEEEEDDVEEDLELSEVEDEEDEQEEEDAEGELEETEDEDMDAEGEDDDADMIELRVPGQPAGLPQLPFGNPQVTVTPAVPLLSVEDKEMVMMDDDDDDELSSLDEDAEGELEMGEEIEEDVEGEEEEEAEAEDSDEEVGVSRGETPDLNKLTRRQRAAYADEFEGGGLMALSNEAQKKKHLTAEEVNMRRTEMARRRKNLSEKRNEEEKMDTINRLLKKQAPKRRSRKEIEADQLAEAMENGEGDGFRASSVYARYIQNAQGSSLAVPEEWVDTPFGPYLDKTTKAGPTRGFSGRMVQEVS